MSKELNAMNIYVIFAENQGDWIIGLMGAPAGTPRDVVMAFAEKKWQEDDDVPKDAVIRAAIPFEMVEDSIHSFREQINKLEMTEQDPM